MKYTHKATFDSAPGLGLDIFAPAAYLIVYARSGGKRRQEFVPLSFECQLPNPTIVALSFWPFVQIQGTKLPRESRISTLQMACCWYFLQMWHLPLAKCRAATWALFPPTFAFSTEKCSICMAWEFLVFSSILPEVLALPIYKHICC